MDEIKSLGLWCLNTDDKDEAFAYLEKGEFNNLKKEYESLLFKKDKPATFTDAYGEMFSGFIKGISSTGKLQVELEDAVLKEFDLKEVKLLY